MKKRIGDDQRDVRLRRRIGRRRMMITDAEHFAHARAARTRRINAAMKRILSILDHRKGMVLTEGVIAGVGCLIRCVLEDVL